MSIEILVNIPAGWVVPNRPETTGEQDIVDKINDLHAIWTGDPQPGTRVHEGRKLIVAKAGDTLDKMEDDIASFGYSWTILGAKTLTEMIRTPAESDVMPFMPDVPITDEEGNVTGYERPDRPRVGIYAGSIPWEYE